MAVRSTGKLSPPDEEAVLAVLASALGVEPSREDRAAWLSMSPAQRQKALHRISTLSRWTSDRGDLTVEGAANLIGVRAKRFYEMASAWRRRPRLSALGVFATPQQRRSRLDARAVNLLQSLLPRVVASDPGKSIDALRQALLTQVEAVSVTALPPFDPVLRIPSKMLVRRMIERELARRAAEAMVGHDVAFDRCPLLLVDDAGTGFALFAIVDRASGLLFGVSAERAHDEVAGFAGAARDALDRIPRLGGVDDWAGATQRVELFAGSGPDGATVAAAIAAVPGGPDLNVATEGTPGRYLRAAAGDRLGRAEFRSAISLTEGRPVRGNLVYSPAAARLEILHGAEAHNAALVSRPRSPAEPPENLMALLRSVSALAVPHDR